MFFDRTQSSPPPNQNQPQPKPKPKPKPANLHDHHTTQKGESPRPTAAQLADGLRTERPAAHSPPPRRRPPTPRLPSACLPTPFNEYFRKLPLIEMKSLLSIQYCPPPQNLALCNLPRCLTLLIASSAAHCCRPPTILAVLGVQGAAGGTSLCLRPYPGEHTVSRPICEVKHLWARTVLLWDQLTQKNGRSADSGQLGSMLVAL